MKQEKIMLSTLLDLEEDNLFEYFSINDIGDNHLYTNLETPLKSNAFEISDDEKKEKISVLFAEIMDVIGMDLNDDSLKGTPEIRVNAIAPTVTDTDLASKICEMTK